MHIYCQDEHFFCVQSSACLPSDVHTSVYVFTCVSLARVQMCVGSKWTDFTVLNPSLGVLFACGSNPDPRPLISTIIKS